jgi:hypothetical protein
MNTTDNNLAGRIYHPQNTGITSIESYRKYGVSRNLIRYNSLNEFHIEPNILACFTTYHILHWRAEYTIEQIKEGVITREGKSYIVVFNACTRFKIKQSSDAVLSFREAQPEYDLPAYVLIKPI